MYKIEEKTIRITTEEYLRSYRDVNKFIVFCKECHNYNRRWSCPPFTFDVDKYLSKYKNAFIIGTKISNVDNLDINEVIIKERKRLDALLIKMEQQYLSSQAFFAGVCYLCGIGECSRINGEPCLHPHSIRPSLEAFGLDIERTSSELLGIELKWGRDGKAPEYITLVSGFFTNEDKIEEYEEKSSL